MNRKYEVELNYTIKKSFIVDAVSDRDLLDKIKQRARGNLEFKKKAIEKGLLPPDFK